MAGGWNQKAGKRQLPLAAPLSVSSHWQCSRLAHGGKAVALRPCWQLPGWALPVAQRLPPQAARQQPDEQQHQAHHEAGFPPLAQRGVAAAEDHRRGARGVVRQRHHDVGGGGHHQRKGHGRRAQGHARAVEGGKHGGDVRRGAGKGVVRVHVSQQLLAQA